MTHNAEAGVQDVLAKIEKIEERYRDHARGIHTLIMETAPSLHPRLWYGMPGYALKPNGPVVLFFHVEKYISIGITDSTPLEKFGNLDEEPVQVAWYLTQLNEASAHLIKDLVQKII